MNLYSILDTTEVKDILFQSYFFGNSFNQIFLEIPSHWINKEITKKNNNYIIKHYF